MKSDNGKIRRTYGKPMTAENWEFAYTSGHIDNNGVMTYSAVGASIILDVPSIVLSKAIKRKGIKGIKVFGRYCYYLDEVADALDEWEAENGRY